MSDFYVTDICASDLCIFSNLKSMSNSQIYVFFQILKSASNSQIYGRFSLSQIASNEIPDVRPNPNQ
jgi:hypothetical protein